MITYCAEKEREGDRGKKERERVNKRTKEPRRKIKKDIYIP